MTIYTGLEGSLLEECEQLSLQICDIGKRLWTRDMVASNDGNISARLSNGEVICTPTGVSKGSLSPDKLVRITGAGEILAGALKPSSEMKMHLRVYQDDLTAHAVVHAHPTFATVFAVRGEAPSTDLVAETVVLMPVIPLAPFAVPSTHQVPDSLDAIIGTHDLCLLEHHGALTWGSDLEYAYMQMERLEHISKLAFYCELLGADRKLSPERLAAIAKVFPAN